MKDRLINALNITGRFLEKYCRKEDTGNEPWALRLDNAVKNASLVNPWFTNDFIITALSSVSGILKEKELREWLSSYGMIRDEKVISRVIGVIAAGNIPMVGFHDFLCVLLSGHVYQGKLSAQDNILLPLIADFILELCPDKKNFVTFSEGKLQGFDAVIATGSNNTHRYFDYYFRGYRSILRKSRNSLAVLQGDETSKELMLLGDDIFLYFGLGCRSVSKLMVPRGYDTASLFRHWKSYACLADHNKYYNNYIYNKSIFLINGEEHLDNGFLLISEASEKLASPVAVLYVEEYDTLSDVEHKLDLIKDWVQCIAGHDNLPFRTVPFGSTQFPGLDDYADGVDTMTFLSEME